MSIFATVEDIEALAKQIKCMKTIEDVDNVCRIIDNMPIFKTKYGLRQIELMIKQQKFSTTNQRKLMNILILKLSELYESLRKSYIIASSFYFDSSCSAVHVKKNAVRNYSSSDIIEFELDNDNKIHIQHEDTTIATFSSRPGVKSTLSICIIDNRINVSWRDASFDFKIFNYDHIIGDIFDVEVLDNRVKIMDYIEQDDATGMIEYLNEYDGENILSEYNCCTILENIVVKLTPIEFAALCGSSECFKQLTLRSPYTKSFNMFRCVIIGESIEIIRLTDIISYEHPEEFWDDIISTKNKDLFNFWFMNVSLEMERIEKKDLIMRTIASFNYEIAEILINNDKEILNDIRTNKVSIYRISRFHMEFVLKNITKITYFEVIDVPPEYIPYALSIIGFDKSENTKNNTFLKALKKNYIIAPEIIIAIRNYIYPNGVPNEIKEVIIHKFYKFIDSEKGIIDKTVFELAQLTPTDVSTYEYEEGISLIDSIMSNSIEYIDISLIKYLIEKGFTIPKMHKSRFQIYESFDNGAYEDNVIELFNIMKKHNLII